MRAKAAAKPASTNVVTLRTPPETTEAIVADVAERTNRQNAELRRRMAEVYEALQADKRKQADKLARIGMALDRVGLDDLVEIGQRMLGGRPVA